MILSSFSSFALTCPNGFISVPHLAPYTSSDFCVMKYEAKDDGNKKPTSKASGVPWMLIDRANAREKCKLLGSGYDLISNDQWQTIARNIAGVGTNWSSGKVANGELNRGISERSIPFVDTIALYNTIENGEFKIDPAWNALPADGADSLAPWTSGRRSHQLSNGNIIWDFSGNVSEWVSDDTLVNQDPEIIQKLNGRLREKDHISFMNKGDMGQIHYGASSSTICASPQKPPYCGMGDANFPAFREKGQAEISAEYCAENYRKDRYFCGKNNSNFPHVQSWKAIHRGGSSPYGLRTGIFSVDAHGPLSSLIGFRCVYIP